MDALALGLWGCGVEEVTKEEGGENDVSDDLGPNVCGTEDGGGVEEGEGEGEGEEERGEGVEMGLGRGVEESDSGVVPAEGGVEQGVGEEDREGFSGLGLGRGV